MEFVFQKSWVCDGREDCLHGEDEYCSEIAISPKKEDNNQQPLEKRSSINEPVKLESSVHNESLTLIAESQKKLNIESNSIPEELGSQVDIRKENDDSYQYHDEMNHPKTTTSTEETIPSFTTQKYFGSSSTTEINTHLTSSPISTSEDVYKGDNLLKNHPKTTTSTEETIASFSTEMYSDSSLTTETNIHLTSSPISTSEDVYKGDNFWKNYPKTTTTTEETFASFSTETYSDSSFTTESSTLLTSSQSNPTTENLYKESNSVLEETSEYPAKIRKRDNGDFPSTKIEMNITSTLTSKTTKEKPETTISTEETAITSTPSKEIAITSATIANEIVTASPTSKETTETTVTTTPATAKITTKTAETSEETTKVDETEPCQTEALNTEVQILSNKVNTLLEMLLQVQKQLNETTCSKPCSSTATNSTTETADLPVISKATCPYHFQNRDGVCLYVQVYPPVSWFDASSLCKSQNSHLVYVREKTFFEKLLKQLNSDRMRNKQDIFMNYHKSHQCGFP
ncbi:hypothetical protein Avbf_13546 [Armadillidium vulgare]|nr:hypothetical protein Avbf_13546 [Armadillidium vulgare]